MPASQLQEFILGSYGMDLRYTVYENGSALNISSATNLKFFLVTPKGEVIEKSASFNSDGSDGVLKYSFVAADLPIARKELVGTWKVQPTFTLSGFNGPLDEAQFLVVDCVRRT